MSSSASCATSRAGKNAAVVGRGSLPGRPPRRSGHAGAQNGNFRTTKRKSQDIRSIYPAAYHPRFLTANDDQLPPESPLSLRLELHPEYAFCVSGSELTHVLTLQGAGFVDLPAMLQRLVAHRGGPVAARSPALGQIRRPTRTTHSEPCVFSLRRGSN